MNDTITVKLCNPLGWIYVDQIDTHRWGWEARLGCFHLDAGICNTKQAANDAAEEAVHKETGSYPQP